ncbi:unnamed protein product [Vitrella brassicaformis CCMP3155]|uniref:Uncharacterized protein n=1 Tax=Vitrella brassicaformis (strain CCMP3155) TaxID=1169540 RepID=A0A0G4EQW8_VITBC|nr:unnamed protein product [Vitrella brassicaformis CCMP3155]|eukprot:CEL99650.1 unnamed protein product [Vitrella brassicaformis CCMP3155]
MGNTNTLPMVRHLSEVHECYRPSKKHWGIVEYLVDWQKRQARLRALTTPPQGAGAAAAAPPRVPDQDVPDMPIPPHVFSAEVQAVRADLSTIQTTLSTIQQRLRTLQPPAALPSPPQPREPDGTQSRVPDEQRPLLHNVQPLYPAL